MSDIVYMGFCTVAVLVVIWIVIVVILLEFEKVNEKLDAIRKLLEQDKP